MHEHRAAELARAAHASMVVSEDHAFVVAFVARAIGPKPDDSDQHQGDTHITALQRRAAALRMTLEHLSRHEPFACTAADAVLVCLKWSTSQPGVDAAAAAVVKELRDETSAAGMDIQMGWAVGRVAGALVGRERKQYVVVGPAVDAALQACRDAPTTAV